MSLLRLERTKPDLSAIPGPFQKNVEPDAPPRARMMAASGMLPLPPAQNVLLLYALSLDADEQIRQAVKMSISDMPADILMPVVNSAAHDGLLDWLAEERSDNEALLEAIVGNRATAALTVARIGRNGNARMVDIVATNQVRLLQNPVIIEQIYLNPNARMATVDGIIELARRNDVNLKGIPGLKEAFDSKEDIFDGGVDEASFQAFLASQALKGEEDEARLEDETLTRAERERLEQEVEEELDSEVKKSQSLHGQIQNMSIAQKIRLATVGSRDAVHILVRDPNKLVHMAAVRSPRVKYADAAKWAKNKSLPDGVINYICMNRDWTRHYDCMLNLVNNPKTPMADVLSFLNHIRSNDLKQLTRNRNVPSQVQRQAKTLFMKRSGGNN